MKLSKGLFYFYSRIMWTMNNLVPAIMIILVLTFWKGIGQGESLQDDFLRFFYGQEIGEFNLLTLLEQLIYYGTPLWLLAAFLSQWFSRNHFTILIRSEQKRKWLRALMLTGLGFQVFYVGVTFLSITFIGILTNKSWNVSALQIGECLDNNIEIIFFCLKIVEFSLLYLFLLLLYIWTENATISFLLVMSLHMLNILPLDFLIYNPAGMVTFSRLVLLNGQTEMPAIYVLSLLGSLLLLIASFIRLSLERIFR
ncbi:hypothetical protein F9U64_07970 [Gracilibacillus oryzae]|uniref:ABC-2 family transporter protein n=1 Tax=Gracilibacillus oryzae TaxID=1672701 RepID=A0A7C8GTN4_9BACI|nr:hypothetical protein [Gracilibacillus oryzae]KAB8137733.1 hypothetical protein F9U64_07970 [Gracilibacillus oryzae]